MPHDLAEPLFKPFHQYSFAPTPRARARGTRALFSLWIPIERIALAGAIEISRSTHPPISDLLASSHWNGLINPPMR